MNAYITLLSTLSYLPGVVVLYDSLKRVNASHSFWVAVSSSIPREVDEQLEKKGMHVLRLAGPVKIPSAFRENSGHWGNTFDKIHLFGLTDFSKLVYLDSDMLVLENLDALFDKPHMSAVAAGRLENPSWTRLNSGLMVIEPQKGLPEKMTALVDLAVQQVAALGNDKIGDQDLVNTYYPDWPERPELHLDEGYNLFYTDLDAYIDRHGYRLGAGHPKDAKPVRVVHFVGPKKPWMKWANAKHFVHALKQGGACKWERQAFSMYTDQLKKLDLN